MCAGVEICDVFDVSSLPVGVSVLLFLRWRQCSYFASKLGWVTVKYLYSKLVQEFVEFFEML